jgi:hypothetical protein
MARLRYLGLVAELAGSGLTNSATSITFAAALTHAGGTAVPTLSGDYIPLTILDSDGVPSEVVYLTAYTSAATTGTISRGKEGTTGVSHSAGAVIVDAHLPSDIYASRVDDPEEWGPNLGYDVEWAPGGTAVPSGWAWVNQGTATATRTKGKLLLSEPTAASGNELRLIERAIPSESTFEATVKMSGRFWPPAGTFGHFICLRDSVSGKISAFGFNGQGSSTWSMGRWDWTNASTSSATSLTTTDAALVPRFWQIKKNSATSWDFRLSIDGVVWDTYTAAHNVTTFLGTAPTHIGVGLWRNNQVTAMAVDWFRVR